jgi:tetratricopeptide (TPR) repeat protein
MNIQRCFEILEIEMTASPEEVKKAHRDLVFIWHPDRVSSSNLRLKQKAEDKMKEINLAYETILSFLSESPKKVSPPVKRKSDSPAGKVYASDSGISDEAAAYFKQGILYGEADNHRQAIKCFSQVIRLVPDDPHAYYNRGIAYNKSGNYKQALKDFSQAIYLEPNHSIAYICRGYIYAELDDFKRACRDFRKAYELGNTIGIEWARKKGLCL